MNVPSKRADPFSRNHLIRDAIGAALYDAMKEDSAIHLFGEGAEIKMHFDAPQIEKEMPDRVHTLPISEDGNVNFAVGASLLGVKPVVDIITADFLYRAMDSICNTAAKLNFLQAEGEPPKTIVIRAEFLMGGPTTGQRPEMLFARVPGLNVVVPSTPQDAYSMMWSALRAPAVTLFFEDRMIRDADTHPEDLLSTETRSIMVFGWPVFRRRNGSSRLTIVTYGLMRQVVESVLDQEGIDGAELLDLRTLYPLDMEAILRSVAVTMKLLIVEPDVRFGGIGAEIAAQVAEQLLGVVIQRLGAPRAVIPASRDGQARMLPTRAQILEAIHGLI